MRLRYDSIRVVAAPDCALRRRSQPHSTPLYRLVQAHYAEVCDECEERYEGRKGFWRGFTAKAVGAYLACSILENSFAWVCCGECRAEFLVAFPSKCRGLWPSCAAKRAAVLGASLREELLAETLEPCAERKVEAVRAAGVEITLKRQLAASSS